MLFQKDSVTLLFAVEAVLGGDEWPVGRASMCAICERISENTSQMIDG